MAPRPKVLCLAGGARLRFRVSPGEPIVPLKRKLLRMPTSGFVRLAGVARRARRPMMCAALVCGVSWPVRPGPGCTTAPCASPSPAIEHSRRQDASWNGSDLALLEVERRGGIQNQRSGEWFDLGVVYFETRNMRRAAQYIVEGVDFEENRDGAFDLVISTFKWQHSGLDGCDVRRILKTS
mmetsp:Transcript_5098/g.12673  ORF Transcript_5098/g.12673 Transcript_5098/m.12673 type:complete len:181 (+) Transcript_5098:285-827(+)